ncbi:MAG TPA: helix-turn-helix domain-containing protein [Jatrophihabitans sp.]|jgi:AcrR family transcriptional regulator|uniref:TetR/AcrR family transcriptional regulator n=1 Tax=Jatrophihabitans sp. TaxID=1932789 RepID=UPI002F1B6C1F
MTRRLGLREQHKRRTREAIGVAAMSLFFEHGYDSVTIADVARQAGVSVATVFNYFDTKEDLFFDEVDPLQAALVATVRDCPRGSSVLLALQEQVIYQLTAGRTDADADEVVRFHAAIVESADLQRHEQHIQLLRRQVLSQALAEALAADAHSFTAELAAAQYLAAEAVIGAELRSRLLGGQPLPAALTALQPLIAAVFTTLRTGLGPMVKAGAR